MRISLFAAFLYINTQQQIILQPILHKFYAGRSFYLLDKVVHNSINAAILYFGITQYNFSIENKLALIHLHFSRTGND